MNNVVFVVGTGTGVGKTTFTTAWLRVLRAEGVDAVGWKPIETGGDDDQRSIAEASERAIPARHAYPVPISPHRSARLAGGHIGLEALADETRSHAAGCELLIVETAGGLFSPLDDEGRTNAELVRSVADAKVVLVAANRLGVLHDVEACTRAMKVSRVALHAIVSNLVLGLLDESVATNLEDLRARATCPVVAFNGELDAESRRLLRALVREYP